MLLVYMVLQVGEFSAERNVRDQMMANVFGQIWIQFVMIRAAVNGPMGPLDPIQMNAPQIVMERYV